MTASPMLSHEHHPDPLALSRAKYLEPAESLEFPASADVPESQLHFELRTLLYQLLSAHLGAAYTVGSDQFVYLDAADPKRSIAPDVYVKCVPRGEPITSWKLWERGAPDVAVEVISDSDSKPRPWNSKLEAYQAMGVKELVSVNLMAEKPELRVWNRVNEVLHERQLDGLSAQSLVLGVHWVIAPMGALARGLRIATQVAPLCLVPTDAERAVAAAEMAEVQTHQAAKALALVEQERARALLAEERAKDALARLSELEALLRGKGENG